MEATECGSHSCTHRWTFADETMRRVTGNSTCSSVPAGPSFTAIKHLVTTLTWRTEAKSVHVSICMQLKHRTQTCSSLVTCSRMHISTCISRAAFTAVAVGELNAVVGASGVAGVRQTLVDVALATLAYVASRAQTVVTSDAVNALAIVEAFGLVGQWVGGGGAVIQINLTVDTYRTQKH